MANDKKRKPIFVKQFLFCLLVLFSITVYSQHFSTTLYNTSNGLCNNTVYCAEQDSNGYMWFGTDDGLVRFDGKTFVRVGTENGLQTNFILSIRNLNKDSLLVLCYPKQIDIVCIHDFAVKNTGMKTGFSNMEILKWGDTLITTNISRYELNAFVKQKSVFSEMLKGKQSNFVGAIHSLFLYRDTVFACTPLGIYYFDPAFHLHPAYSCLQGEEIYAGVVDKQGDLIFGGVGRVLRVRGNKVVQEINSGIPHDLIIHHLMVDYENRIWATGRSKNLYLIDSSKVTEVLSTIGMKGRVVSRTYLDKSNNVWLMSIGMGIVKINPNLFVNPIRNTSEFNLYVKNFCLSPRHDLWIGTVKGLYLLERGSKTLFTVPEIEHNALNETHFLFYKNDTLYTGFKTKKYLAWPIEEQDSYIRRNRKRYVEHFRFNGKKIASLVAFYAFTLQSSEYALVIGSSGEYDFVLNRDLTLIDESIIQNSRVEGSHLDLAYFKGTYYLSSSRGLYRIDSIPEIKPCITWNTVLDINKLLVSIHGTLLLACKNGIWEFDGKKLIRQIRLGNDVPSSFCTSLAYDKFNNLWAGTKNGLYVLHPNGEMNVYKTNNGLPHNSINVMLYNSLDNTLWIGTENGLVSFHPSKEGNLPKTKLSLFVQSALANGNFEFVQNQKLQHNQNNVILELSSPYYGDIQNLQYEYRLKKADSFIRINEHMLRLSALDYGDYSIECRAKDLETNSLSGSVVFCFSISAPYYKTLWFQFLLLFISVSIVIGFVLSFFWRERTKLKLERELALSQHQTYSASINPHFIFNALNSVQHFMNLNDRLNTNRYLTNFAKLIRKNFHATKSLEISLADELDALQIYLQLECMRQPGKFTYSIDVDESLEVEQIILPVMILQPLVENAILHGFSKLKNPGVLTISFRQMPMHILEIIVADNGIGFMAAHNLSNTHQSSGKEITEKRLALYGKIKGFVPTIESYPLSPSSSENPGYVVRITLPIPFSHK